jgi:hypothetical protein
MKPALLGLAAGVLAACGSEPEPDGPAPAVAVGSRPEPAPTPVVHVVVLPTYEVIRRTASPDGKSWCILDVRLEKAAPNGTLRALWTEISQWQTTEWGRFTCRFRVSDPVASVDVNDFMIFGAPPTPGALQPGTWTPEPPGDDDIVIVEEGEDYVIYEVEGVEIRIPKRR